MTPLTGLSTAERALLKLAIKGPIVDCAPAELGVCLKLCGLKLMQRAGTVAVANGWRGSPQAFFLTRDGWALVKAERGYDPVRRAS